MCKLRLIQKLCAGLQVLAQINPNIHTFWNIANMGMSKDDFFWSFKVKPFITYGSRGNSYHLFATIETLSFNEH